MGLREDSQHAARSFSNAELTTSAHGCVESLPPVQACCSNLLQDIYLYVYWLVGSAYFLSKDVNFCFFPFPDHVGGSYTLQNDSACGTWVGRQPDGSVIVGADYSGCYVTEKVTPDLEEGINVVLPFSLYSMGLICILLPHPLQLLVPQVT